MKRWSYLLIFMLTAFLLGAQIEWEVAEMKESKIRFAATAVGNKIFIAGGSSYSPLGKEQIHDEVEVYDLVTKEWEYLTLAVPRTEISAAVVGRYVLFAGGYFLSNEAIVPSDIIEIYDTLSRQWTVANLSRGRYGMATAVVGENVYFAGGAYAAGGVSDHVDIYNVSTHEMSIEHLSSATFGLSVAVSGDSIYFAGGTGYSAEVNSFARKTIDIYNVKTKQWSLDSLSQSRAFAAGLNMDRFVVFAGGVYGYTQSNRVDIYNKIDKTWFVDSTSMVNPRAFNIPNAAMHCGKAYFVGGNCLNISPYLIGILCSYNTIDIFDESTESWETDTLPYGLKYHSVLSVGDKLVVIGGISGSWIQEIRKEILIKSCSPTAIINVSADKENPQVFPNPFEDEIQVNMPDFIKQSNIGYQLVDISGIIRKRGYLMESTSVIEVRDVAPGYYILELKGEGYRRSIFLVK